MSQFALRVITGPQAGQEFLLPEGRELTVGRLEDCEIALDDPNVSRRHATVTVFRGQVSLRDLDSRNGTFINRQRITQTVLQPGDLFTVGNTVLRLIRTIQQRAATSVPAAPVLDSPHASKPAAQTVSLPAQTLPGGFRGSLMEIALLDVLQLLSTTRKSGQLVVRSGKETGRIFIEDGRIYFACMADGGLVDPHKVLYRLLRWSSGTFELEKSDVRTVPNPITEPPDVLLLEGARQLDELRQLGEQLPPLDATVRLASPLPGRLASLPERELDFLQLVLEHGTLRRILDHFRGTDVEGYRCLLELIERKYLTVAPPSAQPAVALTRPQG